MLAWMERVDGFDETGHLIVTESHRVAGSFSPAMLAKQRIRSFASVAAFPGVARARLLPAKGRPIDVSRGELDAYLEEPVHV